jgi:hypothetical protein
VLQSEDPISSLVAAIHPAVDRCNAKCGALALLMC